MLAETLKREEQQGDQGEQPPNTYFKAVGGGRGSGLARACVVPGIDPFSKKDPWEMLLGEAAVRHNTAAMLGDGSVVSSAALSGN